MVIALVLLASANLSQTRYLRRSKTWTSRRSQRLVKAVPSGSDSTSKKSANTISSALSSSPNKKKKVARNLAVGQVAGVVAVVDGVDEEVDGVDEAAVKKDLAMMVMQWINQTTKNPRKNRPDRSWSVGVIDIFASYTALLGLDVSELRTLRFS